MLSNFNKSYFTILLLIISLFLSLSYGDIYTVGRYESGDSYLESWSSGSVGVTGVCDHFSSRTSITNIGPNQTGASLHSPHQSICVGELVSSHIGEELLLIGSDGIGVLVKSESPTELLGNELSFRSVAGVASNVENYGVLSSAIVNINNSYPGKEIITFSSNGVLEVWAYSESNGGIDTAVGLNGQLSSIDWSLVIPISSVSNVAIGRFYLGNESPELAVLKDNGIVEIWDISQDSSVLKAWDTACCINNQIENLIAGQFKTETDYDEIMIIENDGIISIIDISPDNISSEYLCSSSSSSYLKTAWNPFLAAGSVIDSFIDKQYVGDLNKDGSVNIYDLHILASSWLQCSFSGDMACIQDSDYYNVSLTSDAVSSSLLSSSYEASNVIDGVIDFSSKWISGESDKPEWLQLSYIAPIEVEKIIIYPAWTTSESIWTLTRCEYSPDGKIWRRLPIIAEQTQGQTEIIIWCAKTSLASLRFWFEPGTDGYVRVYEIETLADSSLVNEVDLDSELPGIMNIADIVTKDVNLAVAESISLDNSLSWKFRSGDNALWSKPYYDDSAWSSISVGQSFITQGFPKDFGWYRTQFTLPSQWEGKSILLDLGKISVYDRVYLNGVAIGTTGTHPPDAPIFGNFFMRRISKALATGSSSPAFADHCPLAYQSVPY